ncbi:MAG: hypothetical protein IJ419_08200 [Agathobacter sp.]|nr:hypothetical protein [Agathobacter sp.]
MKNKHRNRARMLFVEWKQANPQFFKNKRINKDLYADAAESLLSFLRTKKLSLIDCKIELSTEPIRWTYISIYASMVISYACGWYMPNIKDIPTWQVAVILLILFGAIRLLAYISKITISKNYLEETHFLQIVLERYVELYGDDLATENKLVELFGGQLVKIPANAESIYSEQMQLSKYYQNAFIITVDNNGQKFDYVVYSNGVNCSMDDFVGLCKDQIDKNWDTDKHQIDIIKAPVISGA